MTVARKEEQNALPRVVGIDPGKDGGLALIDKNNRNNNTAIVMPLAGKEVDGGAVAQWLRETSPDLVVIEKVGAMPKQGVASTFTFGKGFGVVIGVVQGLGIPLILATPQAWKKSVLSGTKKDKDAAVAFVRNRYPNVSLLASSRCRKPHDGMADAICIAEHGVKEL